VIGTWNMGVIHLQVSDLKKCMAVEGSGNVHETALLQDLSLFGDRMPAYPAGIRRRTTPY